MKELNEKPNRIAELRRKKGISQERLAEELNVTQASISAYENSPNIPTDILIALSNYFGVTIDYLLRVRENLSDAEDKILRIYRKLTSRQQSLIGEFIGLLD